MMIHPPHALSDWRHHNTHQDSEAQASNPVKRCPALGFFSLGCKQQEQTEKDSDSRRPEPTGWWRGTEAGGESSPQQPHPVHPKLCKVLFGLLQPGSLHFAFHFWLKLVIKVGLGPRTLPPQAQSASFLHSRVTHCSPGPPHPFLVLSTHPPPTPSSASSDWSVVRRCARRLAAALRLSALLLCTANASLPALLCGGVHRQPSLQPGP